jgi:arylsulfatase A-like enzyme
MIRGERYKLVDYPGQACGELYDVVADPEEMDNLYDDERHRDLRERLTRDLAEHLISMETPRRRPR